MKLLQAAELKPGEVYKYFPLTSRMMMTFIVISVREVQTVDAHDPFKTEIIVINSGGKILRAQLGNRASWIPLTEGE